MSEKNQRDKHYKNRTIRIADDVWEQFKQTRRESAKTWNQYIKSLIRKNTHNYEQNKNN